MNNVSVRLVFDRKHVATKKRQSSVQMEVTYQRKRKYVGTGIKLYSDQWGKDLKIGTVFEQFGIRNHKFISVLYGETDIRTASY